MSIKIKQIKDDKGLTSGQRAEPAQELGKSLLEQKEKPRRWTPGDTRNHPDPPSPLDPSDTPGVLVMLCDVM